MSKTYAKQPNRNASGDKQPQQQRTAVLHLAPNMNINATAREVLDIALQTHRAGWRPLAATTGGPWVLEAERAAIRHTEIPMKSGSFLGSWRSRKIVESLIDRERPVLIHAHGLEMVQLATKVAASRRLPLLIDLKEISPVTPGRRKMLQMAAARGAHFRVPSDFMLRHLREEFALETPFVTRVYPGVDLDWYEASRVTPERLHQLSRLWRLPEQAAIIVMATPFAAGGGHDALLDSLTQLQGRDVYLVLVSHDGPAPGGRTEIEKMISAKGLEGKVIMPELCRDWPAACWLATLVVASNSQPRGQAPELLAAQALGRPVIVTECGANAELVLKNETAWLVPPNDSKALAAALETALSMSPQRRIDLAIKTREFMTDHFPMETWRDSLFGIYDTMLSQPRLKTGEAA